MAILQRLKQEVDVKGGVIFDTLYYQARISYIDHFAHMTQTGGMHTLRKKQLMEVTSVYNQHLVYT